MARTKQTARKQLPYRPPGMLPVGRGIAPYKPNPRPIIESSSSEDEMRGERSRMVGKPPRPVPSEKEKRIRRLMTISRNKKCLKKKKRPYCGHCERCRQRRAVNEAERQRKRSAMCEAEHHPPDLVALKQNDPRAFIESGDGSVGKPEELIGDPMEVRCNECLGVFKYWRVKWKNCFRDYGLGGEGVTINDEFDLPPELIDMYYEEKVRRLRGEMEALEKRKEEMAKELEAVDEGLERDGFIMAMDVDEEEEEAVELPIGAEATTAGPLKKKKKKRGGKKFQNWLEKSGSGETGSQCSSTNTAKFNAAQIHFKHRMAQYQRHRNKAAAIGLGGSSGSGSHTASVVGLGGTSGSGSTMASVIGLGESSGSGSTMASVIGLDGSSGNGSGPMEGQAAINAI